MAYYTLEMPLYINNNSYDVLGKRFRIAENIYNVVVKYAIKQLKRLKENKAYKKALNEYFIAKKNFDKDKSLDNKNKLDFCKEILNNIKNSYNLNEYAFHEYVKTQQHIYSKHIDSLTAQKIASAVWGAVESVLFRKCRKIHFKKFGKLVSVEGKKNTSGIKFKFPEKIEIEYDKNLYDKTKQAKKKRQKLNKNKQEIKYRVEWNGLVIPVKIRDNDLFIWESLEISKINYCRIVRKPFKNGFKYFVQLVMDGFPPPKRIHGKVNTGNFRHPVSPNNKVGLDIGISTLAVCSKDENMLIELAPNSNKYDKEIRRLKRKLDRSRRATNPDNFNPDGTIKRGIKLKWVRSKNYIKILFKLKNAYRLKSEYIKLSHNKLASKVLSLGNDIYVEQMNFKALQKKAKKTTVNRKTGKFNSKKRFGKSINCKAPAKLISIIDRKLGYLDKKINKVDTKTFKASQYNHIENRFIKKKLSQRWNKIGNKLVQRDLYSAYLLMNSNKNLKRTNRKRCIDGYDNFIKNHDRCIEEIRQNKDIKLLNSFGIKRKAV